MNRKPDQTYSMGDWTIDLYKGLGVRISHETRGAVWYDTLEEAIEAVKSAQIDPNKNIYATMHWSSNW